MNKVVKILNEVAAKAAKAQEEGRCWVCEDPAGPKIHSEAGSREYQISGTCEECFDAMFKEDL